MTVVKFCGFQDTTEVKNAISVGCDLIGLNFVPQSKRCVSQDVAAEITEEFKHQALFVGVFQNAVSNTVEELTDNLNLSFLQFHGVEPLEYCQSFGLPYIKSAHVDSDFSFDKLQKSYKDAFAYLLDTPSQVGGGSGEAFDWSLFPTKSSSKILLAGGLKASNVKEALEVCKPWGVDVASGVEDESDKKQREKMIQFMDAVRFD